MAQEMGEHHLIYEMFESGVLCRHIRDNCLHNKESGAVIGDIQPPHLKLSLLRERKYPILPSLRIVGTNLWANFCSLDKVTCGSHQPEVNLLNDLKRITFFE